MSKGGESEIRILAVEDSKTEAVRLCALLEAEGFVVDVAHDGETALERVRADQYDLVLMDVIMPGMSGLEACRILKDDPDTQATPVVLVTRLDTPADMLSGLEAGADSYVTKPYDSDQIVGRIQQLLRRPRDDEPAPEPGIEVRLGNKIFDIPVDKAHVLDVLLPILEDLLVGGRSGGTSEEEEEDQQNIRPTLDVRARTGPAHVLIVEDSPTQAARLRMTLEENDYLVDVALTGTEAMTRARSKTYDIVLSDIVMPDMSGYEVCMELRKEFGQNLPIILLTSLDDPSHILQGLEAGASNFIVKPFQKAQLLARVETALAGRVHTERRSSDQRTVETLFRGKKFDIKASRAHMADYLVATFEDILTSRAALEETMVAEKAARESQQFLQASLDALAGLIVILDEEGIIMSVNQAWRDQIRAAGRRMELGDDDVGVGNPYGDVLKYVIGIEDDSLAQAISGIAQVSTGDLPSFYMEFLSGDSSTERWGALRATRFRGAEPVRIAVAHEDITARKLSEDAVRSSEAEYRGLIERAVYGFFRQTPEGKILMANPAMVRMLGYDSEEELLALDSTTIFLEDPSQRSALVEGFLDKGGADREQVEWIRKDGQVISILFSGRPVADDSGEVAYFEIMVEDVTEKLALEEQLRQGQRLEALGQLAGGVAHDFNNILSVIIIEAQLGMKRLDKDDPVHTRLDEIKQAGDRAAALTSQLLAFSRKQVVEPKVLNVNRVIIQMETMLARLISEDISLVSELDETLGNVLADQGQLEQIAANLIVNARDSMSKGGQITIRTSMRTPTAAYLRAHPEMQAEALVCLEIQDEGSGIPPEVKAKMFDPFFTTKERGKGTGLGLATVYGIVQRMGGGHRSGQHPRRRDDHDDHLAPSRRRGDRESGGWRNPAHSGRRECVGGGGRCPASPHRRPASGGARLHRGILRGWAGRAQILGIP